MIRSLFTMALLATLGSVEVLAQTAQAQAASTPGTVTFRSRDNATQLTGYVFRPAGDGPFPAIVMLHGRSGPYSSAANGRHDATTLSQRHLAWGRFWAGRGVLALHVDSFGPRGHPTGFARGTYANRPESVSEQRVRPLDAYGALDWLRMRPDVDPARIGVQGWSNGAMTILAALGPDAPGLQDPRTGFRAALALYPGCAIQQKEPAYRPYAPLLMLIAGADEEVSPARCIDLARVVRERGGPMEGVVYEGAVHAYDEPGRTRQSHPPNRAATEDSYRRAAAFFSTHLAPK